METCALRDMYLRSIVNTVCKIGYVCCVEAQVLLLLFEVISV